MNQKAYDLGVDLYKSFVTLLPEKTLWGYADGSCLNNPGPGGWAVLLGQENTLLGYQSGSKDFTTNNQMELQATICLLENIARAPCSNVAIYLDSQYVLNGVKRWLTGWKKNNWRKSDGKQVLNVDLWKKIDRLQTDLSAKTISWLWVKGHNKNHYNEICDQLANEQAKKISILLKKQ